MCIDIIILAGGFGTRIKSICKNRPKSLLPVGDKVFLDFIFHRLAKQKNIKNVILSLHYNAEQFISYLSNKKLPFEVKTIIEPTLLGTGGAVKYVLDKANITDIFAVVNGDTLLDFDIQKMLKYFNNHKYSSMIGLVNVENADRYGTVKFNEDKAISFEEKKQKNKGWINSGFYLFKKEIFNECSGKFSIENDFFPRLILRNELSIYKIKSEFWDIGVPEDYRKFVRKYSN